MYISAAISACQKGQQWQLAPQMMETMQARGVQLDVISVGAAISVCQTRQQWHLALQMMETMLARGCSRT